MAAQVGWPGLGDEELLIAVANTAHGESDELADATAMRAWWRSLGAPDLKGHRRSGSSEGVAVLRALRQAIRGLAMRNNGIDVDIDPDGLQDLTLRPDLLNGPSLRADETGDLAQDIAAAGIAALLRAYARPGWPRLKACRGEDCRWVFIDNSRNTSRRWCDMAGCGNRAKSAAFRNRHHSAQPRPPAR